MDVDDFRVWKTNWSAELDFLKSQVVPSSKEDFKTALIDSVARLIPKGRFGVLLSGGIDSSLIAYLCKKRTDDFVCYCVGVEGSPDISAAKLVAERFGLVIKTHIVSVDELKELAGTVKYILSPVVGCVDVVDLGVGCVGVAACRLAKKDNINFVFSGLGSDELLGGYSSFLHTGDFQSEAWRRISGVVKDVRRDVFLASSLGLNILFPFLESGVIKSAMGLPVSLKLKDGCKKIVLCSIAEDFSFPDFLVCRKKKAAQYGSGFDKVFSFLAKKSGLSKKFFVDSL